MPMQCRRTMGGYAQGVTDMADIEAFIIGQENMEPEFLAVLHDNLWDLYES